MSVNRITLVITPEQRQAAATAMAQVKSALPALAKLQPGELRELHGFGAKNEVFARGILRALQTHPHIVPAHLDVAGAQADLEAFDALRPLLEAVRLLHAEVPPLMRNKGVGGEVVQFTECHGAIGAAAAFLEVMAGQQAMG